MKIKKYKWKSTRSNSYLDNFFGRTIFNYRLDNLWNCQIVCIYEFAYGGGLIYCIAYMPARSLGLVTGVLQAFLFLIPCIGWPE